MAGPRAASATLLACKEGCVPGVAQDTLETGTPGSHAAQLGPSPGPTPGQASTSLPHRSVPHTSIGSAASRGRVQSEADYGVSIGRGTCMHCPHEVMRAGRAVASRAQPARARKGQWQRASRRELLLGNGASCARAGTVSPSRTQECHAWSLLYYVHRGPPRIPHIECLRTHSVRSVRCGSWRSVGPHVTHT